VTGVAGPDGPAAPHVDVPHVDVPRVVVVSASVGAGHDGAARQLVHELTAAGYAVTCHDLLDLGPPGVGRALRGVYAAELRFAPRSWGRVLRQLERRPWLAGALGGFFARLATKRMRAALDVAPVAVLSTYPLASQAMGRLRRRGELTASTVTFLTDLSVHPLWVATGIDLHVALHEVAAGQARALGAERVAVCRPAVSSAFAEPADRSERADTRARYGLPADGPVALVVAGSWGVGEIFEAATEIAATGLATPVTVCGHNEELQARLAGAGVGVALGWVTEMPALVRAADVVVQNAGGLTSLESMAAGVPVLSYRCLPGHGRTNAEALDRAKLATWVTEPAGLADALRAALADGPGPDVAQLFLAPSAVDAVQRLVEAAP
jgi:UDP-N-acetylglucosamine:LPS N-acetylglucosamine transferase